MQPEQLPNDFELESEDFFAIQNLPNRPPRAKTPLYGSGRIANESDLQSYLSPSDEGLDTIVDDVSLMVESEDGRSLKGLFKCKLYISPEIRRRNILVIGQTGARKTQDHVIPFAVSDISHSGQSVVIVDGKGDLHQKLAPFVKQYRPRRRTQVLNLTDRKRTTHAWNPYTFTPDSCSALEDAQNFCAASQTRAYNYDSIFWDGSAARWIAAFMFRLRERRGTVCPADIHEALELPRSELLRLLTEGPEVPFASGAASFLKTQAHNAETVLATAQNYFKIFHDRNMAAVTSAAEFRFDTLFKKPTVLILEISQRDVERVRPLLNLFFAQLFREAAWYAETQPGCRLPVPLNIYLDDFVASIGKIPEMGQHLNLSRSRDIRVVAAIQSLTQIDHFYGSEAGSVTDGFSTYIFKSPVSLEDASWASAHSGTMTVETIDTHQEFDPNGVNGWHTTSRAIRLVERRVLLPEDIRLAPEHFLYGRASTVILPDVPPFQAWFRPAFDIPKLAQPIAMAAKKRRRTSLRRKPLEWKSWRAAPQPANGAQRASQQGAFTDTRLLSDSEIRTRLEQVKEALEWETTGGSARTWWLAFENENQHRLGLVLRVAEELLQRKATITEFFLAYVYSNTDNVQANLHYLDYSRLKKEEKKQRAAEEFHRNDDA